MPDEPSDAELIEAIREGDDSALDTLVARHLPAVYAFCLRFTGNADDAQDAAQETFLKAWRSLGRFDTKKSFRTWLFAIARNAATDLMRKRRHVPFSFFDSADQDTSIADTIPDEEPTADELFDERTRTEDVRTALETLKPRERLILSMRYEEEFSFEEIAQVLRIPAATVRSLHRRALATLRMMLAK